jgi:hypothetical protein
MTKAKAAIAIIGTLSASACTQAADAVRPDAIGMAHRAVREGALEPQSLRFEGDEAKAGRVCGNVSGRNSFGGMTPMAPYMWTRTEGVRVYGGMQRINFSALKASVDLHQQDSDAYSRIQAACSFVKDWSTSCAQAMTLEAEDSRFCQAWGSGDKAGYAAAVKAGF